MPASKDEMRELVAELKCQRPVMATSPSPPQQDVEELAKRTTEVVPCLHANKCSSDLGKRMNRAENKSPNVDKSG